MCALARLSGLSVPSSSFFLSRFSWRFSRQQSWRKTYYTLKKESTRKHNNVTSSKSDLFNQTCMFVPLSRAVPLTSVNHLCYRETANGWKSSLNVKMQALQFEFSSPYSLLDLFSQFLSNWFDGKVTSMIASNILTAKCSFIYLFVLYCITKLTLLFRLIAATFAEHLCSKSIVSLKAFLFMFNPQ